MYNVRNFQGVGSSRKCVCWDYAGSDPPRVHQGCKSVCCSRANARNGDRSICFALQSESHPNQAPQLSNLMPIKDEVEAYLAKHKLSAILQESITELVKEGMPDNPLAVIASKLNAIGNPVRARAAAHTRLPSETRSFARRCGRRTCPWPRRPSSCRWVLPRAPSIRR